MDFKKIPLKSIFFISLPALLLIGLLSCRIFSKTDLPAADGDEIQNKKEAILNPDPMPSMASGSVQGINSTEDAVFQQQLDHDRQQQRQTKDLKIKLEQTDLELEQEKALAQINKLKNENRGAFNESAVDGQNNLPEIRVDYIGGDSIKKEAILSIGSTSYQVKEKSSPLDNIQVISISDSSVTLHFSTPQDLTKTFDYKPE